MDKFEHVSESISGAPPITFRFSGCTCRAELDGMVMYAETTRDGCSELTLRAKDGFLFASIVVRPRPNRGISQNLMEVASALMWSHWRWTQAPAEARALALACSPPPSGDPGVPGGLVEVRWSPAISADEVWGWALNTDGDGGIRVAPAPPQVDDIHFKPGKPIKPTEEPAAPAAPPPPASRPVQISLEQLNRDIALRASNVHLSGPVWEMLIEHINCALEEIQRRSGEVGHG